MMKLLKELKRLTPPTTLFLIVILIGKSLSHPQCLDFKPPFKSAKQLGTCPEYTEFGCCSTKKDMQLGRDLEKVLSLGPVTAYDRCKEKLRKSFCLKCSPYAAHVYDSESDGKASILPALCRPFCSELYLDCRDFIHIIFDATELGFQKNDANAVEKFCDKAKINDMDYCYPDLLKNTQLNREIVTSSTSEEGCLCLEKFTGNLRNPLIFRRFPDDSGRIAIGEQIGVVHIYSRTGVKIKDSFLDIKNIVETSNREGDERGLLGLEFHPNFKTNGKFYCYFSIKSGSQQRVRLSEFFVNSATPNIADVTKEKVILEIFQPYWNHNGGELFFGIDGYLYISSGDGGGAGDRGNRAQNKNVLLGKMLRIDVDVPPGDTRPYLIPPDNPFVGEDGAQPEIFAYGLRNSWRCDLDEGDSETGQNRGRIICGDVGQDKYEELNIIKKGGNYGWNAREGFACFKRSTCGKIGPEELPIFAYNHTVGKSVTGGHVYRGCMNPALRGKYIFGDFMFGKLFSLEEGEPGKPWEGTEIKMCGPDVCFNGLVGAYENYIMSFGEDEDGEIYMLTTKSAFTENPTGSIYKLVDPRRRGDPSKCRSYGKTYPHDTATAGAAKPGYGPYSNIMQTIICIFILIISYIK